MSAEKPPVKGLCLTKTTAFNRAVGQHACEAVQQDPEQPDRTVRCPIKGIVLETINREVTESSNRAAGTQPGTNAYVEIHEIELSKDQGLAARPDFASDCLTIDDHMPRLDINPYT